MLPNLLRHGLFDRELFRDLLLIGVGLAIVRKLATQYGGDAWVEGPADGGAEFHVTLSRS